MVERTRSSKALPSAEKTEKGFHFRVTCDCVIELLTNCDLSHQLELNEHLFHSQALWLRAGEAISRIWHLDSTCIIRLLRW